MNYDKSTQGSIETLFDSIAPSYDFANTILSFGLHKLWNRALVKPLALKKIHLDLCAGSGAISLLIAKKKRDIEKIILLDFSQGMLDVAKKKNPYANFTFLHADATQIPLEDNSVDSITLAYGLRNIPDPLLCMKEAHRVLRSGGSLGILELTKPTGPLLGTLHALYLRYALPVIGKCITTNKAAYSYLAKSIPAFLEPSKINKLMKEAGFYETSIAKKSGGIATLFFGQKLKT